MKILTPFLLAATLLGSAFGNDIPQDVQQSAANLQSVNATPVEKSDSEADIDRLLDEAALRFHNLAQSATPLDSDCQNRLNRLLQDLKQYNSKTSYLEPSTCPVTNAQILVKRPDVIHSESPAQTAAAPTSAEPHTATIPCNELSALSRQLRTAAEQIDAVVSDAAGNSVDFPGSTADAIRQLKFLTDSLNRAIVTESEIRNTAQNETDEVQH